MIGNIQICCKYCRFTFFDRRILYVRDGRGFMHVPNHQSLKTFFLILVLPHKYSPFHRDAKAFMRNRFRRMSQRRGSRAPNHQQTALEFQRLRTQVLRATCFTEGHRLAEAKLQSYVSKATPNMMSGSGAMDTLERALETIIEESNMQVAEAERKLEGVPAEKLEFFLSHYVATILIHRMIKYVERNAADGVISSEEAKKFLDDFDQIIHENQTCHGEICLNRDITEHSAWADETRIAPRLAPGAVTMSIDEKSDDD